MGEVGLKLAISLVISCCSCQTARWRPACCWLGWGSLSIGDPSKSHRLGMWLYKKRNYICPHVNQLKNRSISTLRKQKSFHLEVLSEITSSFVSSKIDDHCLQCDRRDDWIKICQILSKSSHSSYYLVSDVFKVAQVFLKYIFGLLLKK